MSYSSEVLADSPLGYWRLGDSSGTTATDSSGNSHPGTYSGPTLGATGLLTGDADTAADFDGSNDLVTIAEGAWQTQTVFTVECWFRADNVSSYRALVTADSQDAAARGWNLYLLGGQLHLFQDGGVLTGSSTVTTGTTHHAVLTIDGGGTIRLYLDGALEGSFGPGASLGKSTYGFLIGASYAAAGAGGAFFFDGKIDEVAYYGTALSGARIAAHYAAGTGAGPTGSLAGSMAAFTGSLSGTVTLPSYTGSLAGGMAAFTGSLSGTLPSPPPVRSLDFEDFTLGSPVAYLELQAAFGDTSITADDVAMIDLVSATVADPPTVGDRPGPTNTGAPQWLIDAYEADTLDPGDKWNDPSVNSFTYADGAVITNKVIYGDGKRPKAMNAGVTLDGCLLVGGANNPTWATAVVDCSRSDGTGSGLMNLESCTIAPRNPHDGRDGIKGRQWSASFCEITGTVDGVGIFSKATTGASANVTMIGCWVHDLVYQFPDMDHDDGTHNDCCQYQGGRNVTVRGNYFEGTIGTVIGTPPTPDAVARLAAGYCSQGILIQNNNGAGSDATVVFEENWVSGAITQTDIKDDMVVVYRNNVHYVDSYQRHIRAATSAAITGLDTNVWGDGPDEGDVLTEANDGIVMV